MNSNASRVVEVLTSNVEKPELDNRSYRRVELQYPARERNHE